MYVLSHNHTFDTLAAITTDGELVELEMKIGTRGLHSTARRRKVGTLGEAPCIAVWMEPPT